MKNRFYIFPALIPLVEILPWLLALVGGAAGVMHHVKRFAANRALLFVTAICFLTAAGLIGWQWIESPSTEQKSVLLPEKDLSKTVSFNLQESKATTNMSKDFSLLWQVQSKNEFLAQPVIHNGVIYTGTMDGQLEARNAKTGQSFWHVQKREALYPPIAIMDGIGYQAEGLHEALFSSLSAVSLQDGKVLWERRFRGHLESAPATDKQNGRLYFSGGTQGLWALDAKTGKDIWNKPLGHMDITPLMIGKTIYAPSWTDPKSDDMVLYALDQDGGTIWEKSFPGHPMEDPVTDGKGNIYFGSAHGQIALDRPDDAGWAHAVTTKGEILWSRKLDTMSIPAMSIWPERGLVFFSLKNGKMQALSTRDGRLVWEKRFEYPFIAPALLVTDTKKPLIVAKTADGFVAILDASTGIKLHEFRINANGYAASAYADGILYVSDQYNLYAYKNVDRVISRSDDE